MLPGRGGRTLAERAALSGVDPAPAPGLLQGAAAPARHCWVVGLAGYPDRCPGLLSMWLRSDAAWLGRVVFAVEEDGRVVLVEAWVPAEHLEPVGG